MLRIFSTLLLLLAGTVQLFAQPAELWTRTYGGGSFDYCYSVRPTTDDGFILAGYTQSFSVGSQDVWLVKTDAQGDTVWVRSYGSPESDAAWQVRTVPAGGYIVSGFTQRFAGQGRDIWLLRIGNDGNVLWENYFTGPQWDDAYSVSPTSDGGFLLGGYTASYGSGGFDFYIVKTNGSGDSLWSRTYGTGLNEYCTAVLELEDGFALAGYIEGALGSDFWLVRTDANGDSLWSTQPAQGNCYSLRATSDGGFILIGESVEQTIHSDWKLVKVDANGQTEWFRTYGGELDDVGSVVEQTQDGGYICGGYVSNEVSEDQDFTLWKVNADGDSLWSTTHGGLSNESCSSVQQLDDGSFVAAGGTFSEGEGLYDFYLVRLDSDNTQVLTADPAAIDFGTRWTGTDSLREITLTNISSEALVLLSAETIIDWDIFEVTGLEPGVLEPGQSTIIDARFTPQDSGAYTGDSVVITFDHATSPLTIPLAGVGAVFDLHPSITSINEDIDPDNPIDSVAFELINAGDSLAAIAGFEFTDHAQRFSLTPTELTVSPGDAEMLTVIIDATGLIQSITSELCLFHDQWPNGETCIPIILDFVIDDADNPAAELPSNYSLSLAYPNPFNPATTISFGLPQATEVQLVVFDISGRQVATLADKTLDAGLHSLSFNARQLPSGVYFCRLTASTFSATRKLILMK